MESYNLRYLLNPRSTKLCNAHKKCIHSKILVVCAAVLFLFVAFASCKNTVPSVVSSFNSIIIDYSTQSGYSEEKLAVYIMPSTEAVRFKKMTIEKRDENLIWTIDDAAEYTSSDGTYIGSSQLVSSAGSYFKAGTYAVTYIDAASQKIETMITIPETKAIFSKRYSELTTDDFNKYPVKKAAIYDTEGNLLYFGNEINSATSKQSILSRFPQAATCRWYSGLRDSSCAILSPAVLLLEDN